MKEYLPRILYFSIQNSEGNIIYTVPQHKKAYIKVVVDITNNLLSSSISNNDYSILWTINDAIIQHDDIPVIRLKQESKNILLLNCELDIHEEKQIILNLSLRAAHSNISPKEQLKTFSFFRTIIRCNYQSDLRIDNVGVRNIPVGNKATKENITRPTSYKSKSPNNKTKKD